MSIQLYLFKAKEIISTSRTKNISFKSQKFDLEGIPSASDNPINEDIPLFDDGAGIDDIDQGNIGNCYFLASLGAIAVQNPDLIQNNIVENEDGSFTVTFFEEGQPVEISVQRPETFSIEDGYRAGANDESKELWLTVYEDAYAEWRGGLDEIEGGRAHVAMEELIGSPSIHIEPEKMSASELKSYFNQGAAISLSSDDGIKNNWFDDTDRKRFYDGTETISGDTGRNEGVLIDSHAYIVTNVTEDTTGNLIVEIQNPWDPSNIFEMPYEDVQDAFKRTDINTGTIPEA